MRPWNYDKNLYKNLHTRHSGKCNIYKRTFSDLFSGMAHCLPNRRGDGGVLLFLITWPTPATSESHQKSWGRVFTFPWPWGSSMLKSGVCEPSSSDRCSSNHMFVSIRLSSLRLICSVIHITESQKRLKVCQTEILRNSSLRRQPYSWCGLKMKYCTSSLIFRIYSYKLQVWLDSLQCFYLYAVHFIAVSKQIQCVLFNKEKHLIIDMVLMSVRSS